MTHWKLTSDKTSMYRPHGKTWPEVAAFGTKVNARDDNGRRPSPTYSTEDITVEGVTALIQQHISLPHPPAEMIEEFVAAVNERIKK